MSLKFRNSQGVETPVAGLNGTSGELVPSVALMQSGTATFSEIDVGAVGSVEVTLSTPMPDTDYLVQVYSDNTATSDHRFTWFVRINSASKFTIYATNTYTTALTPEALKWTAFKLMTDTVHEADSAHIAQNTANFAPAFSEVTSYAVGDYVTYNNILYRCTTAHTAGVWVAGHFTAVTVGGKLSSLDALKTDFANFGKIDTASGYLTDDQLKAINYNVCKTVGYAGSAEIPDSTTILVGFMNFTQGTDQQHQLLFQFNTGKVWTRARYGTWTSWQKLVTAPKVLNTRGTSSFTSLSITSLFPEANTCISVAIDITGDAHAHALFSATLTNFNGVYSMGAVSIGGTANITVSLSTDGVLTATGGGNIYNIRVTETKWADHGY